MVETISDMDIEEEQKDNKLQFLEDKIRISDSKIVEEMKGLDINKKSSRERCDNFLNRLNKTLIYRKYMKI